MNVYGFFGGLALLAITASTAVYERGEAAKWEGKYDSLQASYQTAAVAAVTHAKAMEASDLADLNRQSAQALKQAQIQTETAQSQLQAYLAKGKQSKQMDMGHACFNVQIPADELPK